MIHVNIPNLGEEEIDAAVEVLRGGMIAQGPKVAALEEAIAKHTGTEHAVVVNSGTAALHAGLYALGVKRGSEVITTPFTFDATANVALMIGAEPVFVDIDPRTYNIDPNAVAEAVTDKTTAIIPVDLYGQIHDHVLIQSIADEYGLVVLEDACQAMGATARGVRSGKLGDAGVFSLYATKNITTAEGGALVTDDADVAAKVKGFRHHGVMGPDGLRTDFGFNYRMPDILAAIGLVQLSRLDGFNAARIANATELTERLSGLEEDVVTPTVVPGKEHIFHQYAILVDPDKRADLMKHLRERGVGSAVFYATPLHLLPHFQAAGYSEGDFPVAERVAKSVVCLPVNPLATGKMEQVADAVKSFYGK